MLNSIETQCKSVTFSSHGDDFDPVTEPSQPLFSQPVEDGALLAAPRRQSAATIPSRVSAFGLHTFKLPWTRHSFARERLGPRK